ncbi:MAG: HEAT repeat domain-containing protein [Planctomycetes bacterium]|nr:HEAT repeat domain-containing protein [Planctomycetota bacterium]
MRIAASILLLGLAACAASPPEYQWDPSQPKGKRPFKSWVASLSGLEAARQVEAVERLSWKLGSDDPANRDPHWGDLLEELFFKDRTELLYALLSRREIPANHFESLGNQFAATHDERALRLLDACLEFSRNAAYRRSAVWVLGNYAWNPSLSRALQNRLVPLALADPDATTRAFAVRALGIGGQAESVPVLVSALQDRGLVWVPNGDVGSNSVGKWAKEALELIEKSTGRPIPRDPVEE